MDSYDDKARGEDLTPDAAENPAKDTSPPAEDPPAADVPAETPGTETPGTETPGTETPGTETPGIAGLSLRSQVVAALALALVGVTALVHLGMVFLHVAPSNTLSKEHSQAVSDWINPEFEQNWKLFAPNPLQQNIAVQSRAQIQTKSGQWRITEWIDFSAKDAEQIRGSLLPSHTDQNELRRGWDFYTNWHNDKNESLGMRGDVSARYIRRIVLERMSELDMGGRVVRIQVRSSTTSVKPPPWSTEKISTKPVYRTLPWWKVTQADLTKVADEAGVTK
ncbi:hypothetical protein GCM10010329_20590 [Streptomyces spiroverticillatus]|uniref:Uncharacterized protein n=1 Tax=Streptomyces finlayi TaxID=67296 RepID=A0A918WU38_9ACTN|nr:DUF5819 family protein [Streptomyces finlayi]GGZ98889.1 hypothetical protein GCM10010329_20590 [Streptomyces spiroverticillatus]GHC83723.1 hypothetical protein GCM10010334_13030 [Streptomyces finlayi]